MTSEAPTSEHPEVSPRHELIPVHKPVAHKLRTLCGSVFACCMLACVALLLTGFDASLTTVLTGETMGTSYRLVLSEQLNKSESATLQSNVDQALNQLEDQMSTWRPDSELSRFNSSASTDWIPVSHDTAFVVSQAKRIWKISDGAFDPTVAPLIKLWHFAEDAGEQTLPSDADVEQARAAIGFAEIDVRLDPPALRKKRPELQLNLSAIAKGYAVDVVSKLLTDRVPGGHLVEIGGEMRSIGRKADGSSWTAGIETPDALPRQIHAALRLDDQSLATSGDYRNYFEVAGQRYSHTIDPATGRPVTHNLTSVSVLAEDCLTADALATAIEVLGPERGMELAERENVAIYQIVRNDSGFDVQVSGSFPLLEMAAPPTGSAGEENPIVATVLAAVGIFALAIAGMAVGVIFSNRAIKGSCGGLANMPGQDGKSICEVCTVPAEECRDEEMRKNRQQAESSESGFEV
ncbi:MAG: FAD:protein FMN transferase [Planctomycetales bacterium]|jgi:thiamine biosynthesis lipoprotein